MKYFKEILKRGISGAVLAVFINQAIFCFFAFKYGINGTIVAKEVVDDFFISSVLGFFMAASSVIFAVDSWSILMKMIIHFILLTSSFFLASFLGNWMPEGVYARLGYFIMFILIYVIIWFCYKIYWTKKINEVNVELKNRKHGN